MTFKNGNVNRHLGGRKAARTRLTNDHIRRFGHPTYDDNEAEQKRLARPLHKSSRGINPTPKIVNGKQICPVCNEPVSIWGFSAHFNMKHTARNTTGGTANDNPAENKPTTVISTNEGSTPAIPTNNNNITSQPAPHQNAIRYVRLPKFRTGDKVLLNGFKKCSIRVDSLEREILDIRSMTFCYFYKLANGTNTTGSSYHWYEESRLTLVVSVGAKHASPNNEVAASTPTPSPNPQPTILAFPFPNIRTRRYNRHPRLQNKLTRQSTKIRQGEIACSIK